MKQKTAFILSLACYALTVPVSGMYMLGSYTNMIEPILGGTPWPTIHHFKYLSLLAIIMMFGLGGYLSTMCEHPVYRKKARSVSGFFTIAYLINTIKFIFIRYEFETFKVECVIWATLFTIIVIEIKDNWPKV